MTEITFSIGAFDDTTRSVPVTFTHAGVTHSRAVNACLDPAGQYDEAATAARVRDVARGVAYKIDAGVIANPPEPEAAAEPSTDGAAEPDAPTPKPGTDPA